MYFLSFALSIVLVLMSIQLVLGVALPDGLSVEASHLGMEGYAVKPMTFKGTIGGIAVEAEGSIEEIIANMEINYPGLTANLTAEATEHDLSLHTRDKKIGIICCPIPGMPADWTTAIQKYIEDGIKYLNNVKGYCGADPSTCSRVSCSYGASIWLCNFRDNHISATCSWIATFAQDLINKCAVWVQGANGKGVCGVEFDDENFRVIVRRDDSNGC
ncbi:hypothetical protein DL98DRAFT_586440 [Cadophora sp. DSE1049]|nr:hypothetical protein DL98DRAFT_586440 [Cadophora sp. DSE1049]